MAKYELKTKKNNKNVSDFLNDVSDPLRKHDAKKLLVFMKQVTNRKPKMWGGSIVGFGSYHYKYQSGQEGDWPLTGFSPRNTALTIYIMSGFDTYKSLMKRLGTYKTGKSCLYVKRLEDINLKVLEELVGRSIRDMEKQYKTTT